MEYKPLKLKNWKLLVLIFVFISSIYANILFVKNHLKQNNIIAENQQLKYEYEQLYDSLFLPNQSKKISVKATTYNPTITQCDNTPFLTASQKQIDRNNPKKHKFISLSRDLFRFFSYGDIVILEGCGKLNGEYVVADCMNKRYLKRVDILIGINDFGGFFEKATIKHKFDK